MSTNHSTHGLFGWLSQFIGHRVQPPSTGWERYPSEQHTDEPPVPPRQDTDAIRYPLHQHEHEQPGRPFLAWRDEQPVLRPRMVNETGPKSREMLGHIQKIEPQIARWQPSFMGSRRADQESGPIARVVSPNTPIPDHTRDFNPGELPDFVRASLPGLPIQREFTGEPIVRRLDPAGNLATMRPRKRYELEKTPISDLPTVPDSTGLVRAYLDALPPWHPLPPPSAPPSGWLNDNVPEIELWSEPDVPASPVSDANIPTQKLERDPQLPTRGKSATLARVDPGMWQLQQWAKRRKEKESE